MATVYPWDYDYVVCGGGKGGVGVGVTKGQEEEETWEQKISRFTKPLTITCYSCITSYLIFIVIK